MAENGAEKEAAKEVTTTGDEKPVRKPSTLQSIRVHLGSHKHKEKIGGIFAVMQILLIILFGIFANYAADADSRRAPADAANDFPRYGMFQDVHIMIFVGFGFLMTFLKRYGFSAVGFNFLIAAMAIQWSAFLNGIIHSAGGQFYMDVSSLIKADFAAAAALISFGVLIGKTSPLQLLVMTIIELVFFEVNIWLGEGIIGAADAGGSMFIHMFGAYFGLAVSFVLRKHWHSSHKGNGSSYNSDLFAMIGSLFLWICWPTFNGALLGTAEQQHRVAVNTYMSLAACVASAFATALLASKSARLSMDLVQNATLAGGVAVGTMADFMIYPVGAMIIGTVCGVISVLGFLHLSPFLEDKLRLHDTCGVHNLHGMPGLLAGIAGIIAAACATPTAYGKGLGNVFGRRMSVYNAAAGEWQDAASTDDHYYRTAGEQAGYQALALVVTLAMAIVGGLLTGFLLKLELLMPVSETQAFHDEPYWYLPDDVADEEKPHKFSTVASTQEARLAAIEAVRRANEAHAADEIEIRDRRPSAVKFNAGEGEAN